MSNNGKNGHHSHATHPLIGVPELGGVCTYNEAQSAGFGVDENVALLKRLIWVEQRLCDLVLGHFTATPEWEVKGALALHSWVDAEHARTLQGRVSELRHPPHFFEKAPDGALEAFLQEAMRADGTTELLVGIYRVVKPALLAAYRSHRERTNPLADQPTRRLMRFIVLEEEEHIEWGERALAGLVTLAQQSALHEWENHLVAWLTSAGGILGEAPRGDTPPLARAAGQFKPDFSPRRDERFESDNYSFPPHWVYAQADRPVDERMLALVCKRLLEMDVPEMVAPIIWRAREEAVAAGVAKPWTYTAEMTRQMWDEARHSMLGETWLVARGIDFTRVPLNIGFSGVLNELGSYREAHAALYAIEQGLMPQNSGKALEWRVARDSGDRLARLFMDYDWADEVLHVHIGHWLVEEFDSRKAAKEAGDAVFSKVMAMRREHESAAGGAAQREWWNSFVEDVLGFTPRPLAAEVQASDAPWSKNG